MWALARLGDPRCLPWLRKRLLGSRTGFATAAISYPRHGFAVFDLPDIGSMITRADPGARLAGPVRRRLRRAVWFGEAAGAWGEKAAPMVPELRDLLRHGKPGYYPSPAAAQALGQIGPAAQAAARELRRHAMAGSAEAAWALWRVTGQTSPAASILTGIIQPLTEGRCRPVHLAALRYLAAIAQPSARTADITRAILADPRRLCCHGGWRAFHEDDQLRAAAAGYLASTTGQPS